MIIEINCVARFSEIVDSLTRYITILENRITFTHVKKQESTKEANYCYSKYC